MKSILQKKKRCLLCHTEQNLHLHHNMSDEGVHSNRKLDLAIKEASQKKAMSHYSWDVETFIGIFGRNYIEEEI
jgi:hypothetical protein